MAPHRFLAAVFAALLALSPATAANLGWTYSATVTPANLVSGRWEMVEGPNGPEQRVINNADYSVGLEGQSGAGDAAGQVRVFTVTPFGVGFDLGDGSFDPTIHQFDVNLALTDVASGQSEVLAFKGTVSGAIGQTGADLQFALTDPAMKSTTLGDTTYDVTLQPLTVAQSANTGAPQEQDLPTLMAAIAVRNADNGQEPTNPPIPIPTNPTDPLDTPEPGTLTLAGLAFAGLGLAAWRKRLRRTA